jgi:multisubunit Na+/H+ antiporter MnhE subunit
VPDDSSREPRQAAPDTPGAAGSQEHAPPATRWLIVGAAASFALLFGMYIALVGEWDTQDVVTGVAVSAASVVVGWILSRGGRALPAFRRDDVQELIRLLPRTLVETVQVFVAVARRRRGRGGMGATRIVETGPGAPGWKGARRAGLLGALLSVTPNSYVIGLDPETGRATVHELVPSAGGGTS